MLVRLRRCIELATGLCKIEAVSSSSQCRIAAQRELRLAKGASASLLGILAAAPLTRLFATPI